MKKIITLASAKGGSGKTVTAFNTGYELSRLGNKVLIVDPSVLGGVGSILKNESEDFTGRTGSQEFIEATPFDNLFIAHINFVDDLAILDSKRLKPKAGHSVLAETALTDYDYLLIDAPSGVGALSAKCIKVADSVIVTVEPGVLDIKALYYILDLIKDINLNQEKQILLEGILITKADFTLFQKRYLRDYLREKLPHDSVFKTIIAFDYQIELSLMNSIPVSLVENRKTPLGNYFDFAKELIEKHQSGSDTKEEVLS